MLRRQGNRGETYMNCAAPAGGIRGEGLVSLANPAPNHGLQATANSLRSCLAPAIGGA